MNVGVELLGEQRTKQCICESIVEQVGHCVFVVRFSDLPLVPLEGHQSVTGTQFTYHNDILGTWNKGHLIGKRLKEMYQVRVILGCFDYA
jgi:hypothetical protein